jgi:hypothetical protein
VHARRTILGGDIDTEDLCSAALLQQLRVETEATGEIQDALAGEVAHHAEEGIALGPFQRGRPRVFIIFAANLVILRCLLHAVFLLVFLQLACCTLIPACGPYALCNDADWNIARRSHCHRLG